MPEQKNGYLRMWQFLLGILILVAGILGSYYKTGFTAENNTIRFEEFKTETRSDIKDLKLKTEGIDEVKLNLKIMMEGLGLKYVEK